MGIGVYPYWCLHQHVLTLGLIYKTALMNCRLDPDTAIEAPFFDITLDETASPADNATHRQADATTIRKDTFYPVINLKGGVTYRALGHTMPWFDGWAYTKWAGQVFMALGQIFFRPHVSLFIPCRRPLVIGLWPRPSMRKFEH